MKNFAKSVIVTFLLVSGFSQSTLASEGQFQDVTDQTLYNQSIEWLASKGIIQGYEESPGQFSFRPDQTATRAEFLKMLLLTSGVDPVADHNNNISLADKVVDSEQNFYDEYFSIQNGESLASLENKLRQFEIDFGNYNDYLDANALYGETQEGYQIIVQQYLESANALLEDLKEAGDTFDELIAKPHFEDVDFDSQMFVDMHNALIDLVNGGINRFSDVPYEEWYYEYVIYAYLHDIAEGYLDATFRPNNSISRAEAIKLAILQFDIFDSSVYFNNHAQFTFSDLAKFDWYTPYLDQAIALKLVGVENMINSFGPHETITRKEIAEMMYRMYYHQNQ